MKDNQHREAWNKGKLVGQKPPLKPKDIWAIRIQLQNAHRERDLAMFNLAIDSKLRGCDLVNLRVRDITHGNQIMARAMVIQRKTQRPVQFELTEPTRTAVIAWIEKAKLKPEQYLFPSRLARSPHVSTRQYARIVYQWVAAIGLDPTIYGTHTMRRTKATLIYKRTKNLRAVQILFGHTKLESTVRYLGIEVDDALEISEQTEIYRRGIRSHARQPDRHRAAAFRRSAVSVQSARSGQYSRRPPVWPRDAFAVPCVLLFVGEQNKAQHVAKGVRTKWSTPVPVR